MFQGKEEREMKKRGKEKARQKKKKNSKRLLRKRKEKISIHQAAHGINKSENNKHT